MAKKNPYKAFLNWCAVECQRVQECLALTEYCISIDEEPTEFDVGETVFEIRITYPYKNVNLAWSVSEYDEWKADSYQVTKDLVHEMIHILVEPLAHLAQKRFATDLEHREAVEGVVDHLANVLARYLIK